MKNFVIIGASSGIGQAIANQLSEFSAVSATYCTTEKADVNNIKYHYLNVLDESPDFSFLPEVIDGLVYCPGSIQLKPFARINTTDFKKDFELNVLGAITCIQQALGGMKKSTNASIVLFSTVAVQMGMNFHSMVSTSKGAIEGLTHALSAELAPNIRVNCIAPSLTDTPLAAALLSSEEKRTLSDNRHPLKRIGRVEDLANMAKFLLSDESTWITGQIFHVDGGMSTIK